jgi:hypothetical protein
LITITLHIDTAFADVIHPTFEWSHLFSSMSDIFSTILWNFDSDFAHRAALNGVGAPAMIMFKDERSTKVAFSLFSHHWI